MMNKTSKILADKEGWNSVEEKLPLIGEKVAIRMYIEEDDIEDVTLGLWNGEEWEQCSPYPLYDYSPFTNKDKVTSTVTHWHEPNPDDESSMGDIKSYESRFNIFINYNELDISVDDEHREIVFRGLMGATLALGTMLDSMEAHASDNIDMFNNLVSAYHVIYDLHSVLNNKYNERKDE